MKCYKLASQPSCMHVKLRTLQCNHPYPKETITPPQVDGVSTPSIPEILLAYWVVGCSSRGWCVSMATRPPRQVHVADI
jgi:hypothetical protein